MAKAVLMARSLEGSQKARGKDIAGELWCREMNMMLPGRSDYGGTSAWSLDRWLNSGGKLGAVTDLVISENCSWATTATEVITMLCDREGCWEQDRKPW